MFNFFETEDDGGTDIFNTPRDLSALATAQTAEPPRNPPEFQNPSTKKAKWRPEEDKALIESVKIHGTKNWVTVASLVPGRNPKQCRERWTSHLDPNLSHNEFTPQEDTIIILQHQANGSLWAKIAAYLPGRSATAVKNRFNFLSRRHLPEKMARYLSGANTPENSASGSLSPFNLSDPMCDARPPEQKPKEPSSDAEQNDNFDPLSQNGDFDTFPDPDEFFYNF